MSSDPLDRLAWTSEVPTEPGVYIWRRSSVSFPRLAIVDEEWLSGAPDFTARTEWCRVPEQGEDLTDVTRDEGGGVDEVRVFEGGKCVAHMECMVDYYWLRLGEFVADVDLRQIHESPDHPTPEDVEEMLGD